MSFRLLQSIISNQPINSQSTIDASKLVTKANITVTINSSNG